MNLLSWKSNSLDKVTCVKIHLIPYQVWSGLQLENIKWDLEPEWQESGGQDKVRDIKHGVIKFHLILSLSRDTALWDRKGDQTDIRLWLFLSNSGAL